VTKKGSVGVVGNKDSKEVLIGDALGMKGLEADKREGKT